MTEINYKEAYEKEREKCIKLEDRLTILESQNADLQSKLDKIKNSIFWKMSKPFRVVINFFLRQKQRLERCDGFGDFLNSVLIKLQQKKKMKNYGTESFPTEEEAKAQREAKFERMVKVSVLVPLWNTPKDFLCEMIESVMNQTYENWELCLADGSDAEHAYVGEVCKEYQAKANGRIVYQKLEKNEGISGNTNQCYKLATGEFIGLFDHDDLLHPSVLYEYVKAINERGADYLYCDEITFHNGDINKMLVMHFKPDYALDTLRANNYICHFSVFARELLEGTELFRTSFDGSQDHDMILRLTDRAKNVVHIPKVLYYWRSHAGSVASGIGAKPYAIEAAKGAVADHLRQHGLDNFQIISTRACETIFRIRYEVLGCPRISIVIANKDHAEDLKRCVDSIMERSTYNNYEIIIVENNSTTEEIEKLYKEYQDKYSFIKVVRFEGAFNYSAVNNLGVKHAEGEYILLLNNDTEVITPGWMEELLMYAQREDVGAVGAKLLYADRTIQHAGVILKLGAHRTAGHGHYKQPDSKLGYMGRLCYAQNVSAVTGACLLVKKAVFEQVGGLEESFQISLNDVDFCLKLRELGYLNVWTPFAELYHHESISRGLDDKGEKAERYNKESEAFRTKWKEVLEQGDPYYNPNFTLDRSDFVLK